MAGTLFRQLALHVQRLAVLASAGEDKEHHRVHPESHLVSAGVSVRPEDCGRQVALCNTDLKGLMPSLKYYDLKLHLKTVRL